MTRTPRPIDPGLFAALTVLLSLGGGFLLQTRVEIGGKSYFSLADDAMISMTFARNLATGHGLVWNPGEAPIEGMTNLLWTLWMALLHLVAPSERWPALLTALSGLGCLAGALFGADALARRWGLGTPARLFGLLSCAALYAPIFWTLRGFEVGILLALDMAMLAIALDPRDTRRFGVRGATLGALGGLAFLVRMDSAAMSGTIVLASLWLSYNGKRALMEAGVALLVMAAFAAGLFAFRLAYFGDLLPNTAYLKLLARPLGIRLHMGFSAVAHAAVSWAPLVLLSLAPLLRLPAASLKRLLAHGLLLGVIGSQILYTVYAGGDSWEWSRFPDRFVSAIGFPLCIAAASGLDLLLSMGRLGARAALIASVSLAAAGTLWSSAAPWRDTFEGRGFQIAREGELLALGRRLEAATPPGFRYALTWAGTIPYVANGRVAIDLLGKMDKVIAREPPHPPYKPGHDKLDIRHSIGALRPDAILQTPYDSANSPGWQDLLQSWGYARVPGGWWIRADALPRLRDPSILQIHW